MPDFDEQILEGLESDSLDANTQDNQDQEEGQEDSQQESEQQDSQEETSGFEIDGEKFTAEELKEAVMLRNNYTQKMQEIAEYRKEKEKLEPILQAVKTPEDYTKVMNALAKKEEQIEAKAEDVNDALSQLDPTDPYAKTLRTALDEIKQLKGQLDEQTSHYQKDAEYLKQKQLQEQQEQYQKFIGEVKDYASDGLNFETDIEKELYDIAFTASLSNVDTTGITAQEYKEIAKTIGQLVYKDVLQKYKDSVVNKYRESKKGGAEERLPDGEEAQEKKLDGLDLQQKIEQLL